MPNREESMLYHQLRVNGVDPDAVQAFFREHKIGIDLKNHMGLENVVAGNRGGNRGYELFFGRKAMQDMEQPEEGKTALVSEFIRALKGEQGTPGLYVYSGKEKFPRRLTLDPETGAPTLSEPVDNTLKKPKKPGFFRKLGWRIRGTFQRNMDAYRERAADYERDMDFFAAPQKIRTASDPSEQIAEQEKNQRNITQHFAKVEEDCRNLLQSVTNGFDEIYGDVEAVQNTKDDKIFDRYRFIMIGGKPLTAILNERVITEKKSFAAAYNGGDVMLLNALDHMDRNVVKDMAARIILSARMQGLPVKYFVPELETGRLIKNGDSDVFTYDVPDVKYLQEGPYRNAMRAMLGEDADLKFDVPEDNTAMMKEMALTGAAVRHHIAVNRVSLFKPSGTYVKDQLLGRWAESKGMSVSDAVRDIKVWGGLTLDRGSITSHALAFMAMQVDPDTGKPKYTLDQITGIDPSAAEARREAAEEVVRHIEAKDFEWIARVNMQGGDKLCDMVDDRMTHFDFSESKPLITNENVSAWIACSSIFDLSQELSKVKKHAASAYAKDHQLNMNDPNQKKTAEQEAAKFNARTTVLGVVYQIIAGERVSTELALGVVNQDRKPIPQLFTGEVIRTKLEKCVTNGLKPSEFAGKNEAALTGSAAGMIILEMAKKEPGQYAELGQITDIRSMDQMRALGIAGSSGALRKAFRFDTEFREPLDVVPVVKSLSERNRHLEHALAAAKRAEEKSAGGQTAENVRGAG